MPRLGAAALAHSYNSQRLAAYNVLLAMSNQRIAHPEPVVEARCVATTVQDPPGSSVLILQDHLSAAALATCSSLRVQYQQSWWTYVEATVAFVLFSREASAS